MEAPDYEVLSVREQLFHERIRECIAGFPASQPFRGFLSEWSSQGFRGYLAAVPYALPAT
ncbi:LMBR1L isoform 5 [Pongo abelii]|uniref:LMBR1L isoform 5 n=1 Tax=Pongo abelii TaxID=9601 RepID=A0A2J8SYQ4_PONAB|nr:LMBR1L isoform 5 [Pongo abelii]